MKLYSIIFCSLLFLTACSSGSNPEITPDLPPERIMFSGGGNLGIFDPSVTKDAATGRLWMSYSAVDSSTFYAPTLYWGVSLRLAYSDDNGVSWLDAGVTTAANIEATVGPLTEGIAGVDILAGSQGIWQSETSTLIYDPAAPASERWKLIWHQYLNANLTSLFVDYGWLAMKTAATPLELGNATPIKLFGSAGLQADNVIAGSPVFSPIAGAPVIQLNTDITQSVGGADLTELDFCIFVEPGLHVTNSAVYLTVYCGDAISVPSTGKVTEYIMHFRCNSPCTMTNPLSWEYLGRVLTPADAQAETGDNHYQAPAVVENNNRTYLLVNTVDTSLMTDRYNGCRVYEFTNINSNQLVRSNNQLVEITRVDGEINSHHGACEALSGMDGGIMLSQFGTKGTADAFQIYKSQIQLP